MKEALQRVVGRVRLMVGRALLHAIDDAAMLQSLQITVREGEVRESVERFQNYGFTSVPFADAEAIALAVGGSTDHMVVICVDDRRYRMKGLAGGEVAIYTDEGDYVHFLRGRTIKVVAGTKVIVDTPLAQFTGDVQIDGNQHTNGNATVDQNLQVGGNSHVSGGSTVDGTSHGVGTITSDTDVIGGGKSLKTHTHNDPQGGVTGGPN